MKKKSLSESSLEELLIMLCFVMGISMFIFAFFCNFEGVLYFKLLKIAGIISMISLTLATANFLKKRK
jgi:hypothetical protein